jgi:FixJ family two-component response regulator
MSLLTRGQPDKHVGATLGLSEITLKAHRGRMMRKMNANSRAALVTMTARLRGSLKQE